MPKSMSEEICRLFPQGLKTWDVESLKPQHMPLLQVIPDKPLNKNKNKGEDSVKSILIKLGPKILMRVYHHGYVNVAYSLLYQNQH